MLCIAFGLVDDLWLQKTALHEAAGAGHSEVVEQLLQAKANVDAADGYVRQSRSACVEQQASFFFFF